jgi:hypothetical protein
MMRLTLESGVEEDAIDDDANGPSRSSFGLWHKQVFYRSKLTPKFSFLIYYYYSLYFPKRITNPSKNYLMSWLF